jgi:sterol desaturase/sphingolipid hydroxylase (fatty acid hydroxylase superfamily)
MDMATIRAAAHYIIHSPVLLFCSFWVLRITAYTFIERRFPAYDVPYRKVVWRDALAGVVYICIIGRLADYGDDWLPIHGWVPSGLQSWPFVARFALYVVLADLGNYWVHRLIHTRHLWRIHKWHHSPTYMYWFAGIRASLLQEILINAPYIAAAGLIDVSLLWISIVLDMKSALQNDWMHMNVPFGSRWLERFIITPRYHHVHHSDNPDHYGGNFAALFPVWDHLFGTYIDPAKVPKNLTFGIGERVPAIRLAIGI